MAGLIWGSFFWCCALILASVGLYSLLLKTPVSIWYRYDINPEKLSDVKAYNLYSSIVWFSYAFLFLVDGFIGFAGAYRAGLVFSALLIIPCIQAVNIALKKILVYFTVKPVENEDLDESETVEAAPDEAGNEDVSAETVETPAEDAVSV